VAMRRKNVLSASWRQSSQEGGRKRAVAEMLIGFFCDGFNSDPQSDARGLQRAGERRRQGSDGWRTVHELRPRKDQPWVAANCDVLNDELIASGLVGDACSVFAEATATRSSPGLPRNLQRPELDAVEGCSLLTLEELKRRCIAKVLEGTGYKGSRLRCSIFFEQPCGASSRCSGWTNRIHRLLNECRPPAAKCSRPAYR